MSLYHIGCQRVFPTLLVLSLVALTGCSSFNREWKRSLALPSPTPTEGITGPWEGHWRSDQNGHNGPLRCLITSGTNGTYQAWFRAKYKSMRIISLSYAYKVSLEVIPSDQDQIVVFSGKEDLGTLAGGIYTYEGKASTTNFHSTYRSSYDHGTFQMTRPQPPTP